MSEDKYSTRRSRKSADAVKGRASGGKLPMFKIKKKVTELFILTPKDLDESVVFTTYIHKFTQGHGKNFKVLKQCASPAFTQEADEITDLGWSVRDEFGKDDSKSKADLWKQMVADNDDHVLVMDLDDVEEGPQMFKMPHKVSEVVIPALDTCMDENEGDLHNFCHPEEGKILVIETNGKDGFARKYNKVFFDEDKPACLFGDNVVTEEEFDSIMNRRPSMEKSTLQPKFSKEEFESYIDFCYEKADEIGIDLDALGKGDNTKEDVDYSADGNSDAQVDTTQDIDLSAETEASTTGRGSRGSRGSEPAKEETTTRGRGRGRAEEPAKEEETPVARGGRGSRGSSTPARGGRARR